ncbi:MAG: TolC family protein [Candidatus Omnitrophica bacterium]|nr:TolC family protein [Candidatus Omnitrophota bacterium]MDE2009237.1 TolC family protein [Candidatus Omnitrophota bacterium]MDE2213757.1 TolC family protein [Candidatus Omnitrophota bacterium]MDE2230667.1 TolC family protein [Candidatus Omnitrophota bacterium]
MKKCGFFLSLVVFVLLTLHSSQAFAVSLGDCKALALKNSSLIAAYEDLIKSSVYSWRKERSALLGQLTAYYQPDNIQFSDRSDLKRTHGFETRMGAAFSWDLQKILTDYPALGRLDVTKNKLVLSIARSELLKNVTQDYDRLYVLLEKRKEYVNVLELFQSHIREIKQLQSKGVDAAFDLDRARVQFQSLNISLNNIDSEIKDVLLALNSLMNSSYTQRDFSLKDAPDMSSLPSWSGDYSVLQQSRLDKVNVDTAKEMFKQSRLYYLPTVQLGLEHNVNTVDPNVEEYRSYLSLNFDIFDFGQKANEEKSLKYGYEYQEKLFKDDQRKLKVRIEQMTGDLASLRGVYRATMENLKNAQAGIKTARAYYRQGKIKEIDLLSAFSDYLTAVDQSYDAQYNFLAKKAELAAVIEGNRP